MKLILSGEYYDNSITTGFSSSAEYKSKVHYSGITPSIKSLDNSRIFLPSDLQANYTRTQTKVNAKTNKVIGKKEAIIRKGCGSTEYSVDVKI